MHAGQDYVQIAAAGKPIGPGQVAHFTMQPGVDPAQIGIQARRRQGMTQPDPVEAEAECLGFNALSRKV